MKQRVSFLLTLEITANNEVDEQEVEEATKDLINSDGRLCLNNRRNEVIDVEAL